MIETRQRCFETKLLFLPPELVLMATACHCCWETITIESPCKVGFVAALINKLYRQVLSCFSKQSCIVGVFHCANVNTKRCIEEHNVTLVHYRGWGCI